MRTIVIVPGHNKVLTECEVSPGTVVQGWEPSEAGKLRCRRAAQLLRDKKVCIICTGDLCGNDPTVPSLATVSSNDIRGRIDDGEIVALGTGYYSAEEARAVADYLLPKSGELAKEGVLLIVATSEDHGEMIAYTLGHLFRNDPFLKSVKIRVGIADETPAYSWLTRQILWAVYRLDPAWERWPSAPLRWIANRRR